MTKDATDAFIEDMAERFAKYVDTVIVEEISLGRKLTEGEMNQLYRRIVGKTFMDIPTTNRRKRVKRARKGEV